MESKTVSHYTGSIVYLPPDKAGSFALDLEVKARVRLLENKKIFINGYNNAKIKKISRDILNLFGYKNGLEIEIISEISYEIGLGGLESISSAVAMGIASALAIDRGSINVLKIDRYLKEQFLEIDGKIVNKLDLIKICASHGLRFDKLCASMYGGFFLCNNRKQKILRRGEMENLHALVITTEISENLKPVKNELRIVWNETLKGNLYTAMRLNSHLLSNKELVDSLITSGALTVACSDGTLITLYRDKKFIEKMEKSLASKYKLIRTKITNNATEVLRKPRKIVRTKEFLEMDGGKKYYFL
ncbi:MAG TPA: hypothetical protein EYP86_03925 [Candidatus Altiarchaeales archaeon]|nr:hypothetical protein [Candidatus Altiarchaeales archaeon]